MAFVSQAAIEIESESYASCTKVARARTASQMPADPLRSQASLGFTAGALPHAVMKNATTSALAAPVSPRGSGFARTKKKPAQVRADKEPSDQEVTLSQNE